MKIGTILYGCCELDDVLDEDGKKLSKDFRDCTIEDLVYEYVYIGNGLAVEVQKEGESDSCWFYVRSENDWYAVNAQTRREVDTVLIPRAIHTRPASDLYLSAMEAIKGRIKSLREFYGKALRGIDLIEKKIVQ